MIFSSNSKEQPQGYFRIDTIFFKTATGLAKAGPFLYAIQ